MAASTRDQQKDLIREVLREQAAAAAASGGQQSSEPPTKKATLMLPEPDSNAFRREYGFCIAGECDDCGEPRFVSGNLAACCGCDSCNCHAHRMIRRELYKRNGNGLPTLLGRASKRIAFENRLGNLHNGYDYDSDEFHEASDNDSDSDSDGDSDDSSGSP